MPTQYKKRRSLTVSLLLLGTIVFLSFGNSSLQNQSTWQWQEISTNDTEQTFANEALKDIAIKDRGPKTGYSRDRFGNGWAVSQGCDTRNIILNRDLEDVSLDEENCYVLSGTLKDPYTGKTIFFKRGIDSGNVQIDHVVALSDAWQKGAAKLNDSKREELANDPLNLLAVDGPANQQKGDADAASWLPPNKSFRCQYVARQIAVKAIYQLWMTRAEHDAIAAVLQKCPDQMLPNT